VCGFIPTAGSNPACSAKIKTPLEHCFSGVFRLNIFRSPLFEIPGYRRMWLSILFSNLGGQITLLALPLTAVFLLNASPTQMGLLTAMEIAPFVLLSLPGGVLIDRMQKLPLYIAGEIFMGCTLLLIPLAWLLDALTMGLMYGVSFALGTVYTIAGSASQIVLTQLVGRDKLVQAYSQNAIAGSMAEVLGPGMAGLLIRLFGAPLALVMDAFLLIGSVLMLRGIRIHEEVPPRATWKDRSFRHDLMKGVNFVKSQKMLIEMAIIVGAWQFFAQLALSVQIIFAVKDLGLNETLVSMSFVALGVGSILGGMAGPKLSSRFGPGPALILGIGITSVGWISLLALDGVLPSLVLFSWMLICFSWGATLLFVNFLSLRQSFTPTELLGRMTTTMRWLILLPAGPGAILGGWMAEHWGMRSSLGAAGAGTLLVAMLAYARPYLKSIKQLPEAKLT
jgi:MFS family permease